MNHTGWSDVGGFLATDATCTGLPQTVRIDLTNEDTVTSSICAAAATGPIGLTPGASAVIYFKLSNGTLTSLDSGISTTVNVFAGKAGAPQSVTVTGTTYTP